MDPLPLAVRRCALVSVLLATVSAPTASGTVPGTNGRIAFERHSNGQSDLYATPDSVTRFNFPTAAVDPAELTPGTSATSELNPAYGPIGEPASPFLAYDSPRIEDDNPDGDREIWVLDTNGNLANFTDDPADDYQPSWDLNGTAIAFVRRVGGNGDIFIKSFPDGAVETNVTASPEDEANPTWSNAGDQLAFEHEVDGRREIRVMDVTQPTDDTGYGLVDPRDVTAGEPSSFRPSWFHFDKRLAGGGPGEEGGVPTGETEGCWDGGECVDAPANRLVYAGVDVDPPWDLEIWFVTQEVTGGVPPFSDLAPKTTYVLTDNAVRDSAPTWAPNGDMLAFTRGEPGSSRIYVMTQDAGDPLDPNVEGARELLLNPLGADDRNPAWQPLDLAEVSSRIPCGRRSRRRVCHPKVRTASANPTQTPQSEPQQRRTPTRSVCTQPPGGPGHDLIVGTPADDVLCGRGGADTLRGRGGADYLLGGTGADTLRGGPGDDRLSGEGGADWLFGQSGSDRVFGGPGGDTIDGGPGHDWLFGEPGRDVLRSRDGARDHVFGGGGRDRASLDRRDGRAPGVELRSR
jgi:hypothetical protein